MSRVVFSPSSSKVSYSVVERFVLAKVVVRFVRNGKESRCVYNLLSTVLQLAGVYNLSSTVLQLAGLRNTICILCV